MVLYRPVGIAELRLIAESGFRRFPPRLAGQPIFYPVLNFEYAAQIARDWNTKDAASGWAGFVTRFSVREAYARGFEERVVGEQNVHRELWIPAERLNEFNSQIDGLISVDAAFYGAAFALSLDARTGLPAGTISDTYIAAFPGRQVPVAAQEDKHE